MFTKGLVVAGFAAFAHCGTAQGLDLTLTDFDLAIWGDATTSYVLLKQDDFTERNPLLGEDPATVALVSSLAAYSLRYAFKNTPYCTTAYRSIAAFKIGATVNNLGVGSGVDNDAALGLLITSALFYNSLPRAKKQANKYCYWRSLRDAPPWE